MSDRPLKEKYGVSEAPIQATRAFRRESADFPDSGTKQECWITINDNLKTVTYVNTYNGKTGLRYAVQDNTFKLPGEADKKFKKKLSTYTEVDVDKCPVAIAIDLIESDEEQEEQDAQDEKAMAESESA